MDHTGSIRQGTERGTIQSASELGTIAPSQIASQTRTQDYFQVNQGVPSNRLMSHSGSIQSI